MGLLDTILGRDNPFSQYVDQNRNFVGSVGAGLARGPNLSQGLANAAQMAPEARRFDDANALAAKAEAERQAQIQQQAALRQKYAQFFQQQNQPVYAQFVADGVMDPGQAYGDWQKSTSKNIDPTTTVGGRTQLAQQYQLSPEDAKAFVLTGKLPDARQNPRAGVGQPITFRNKKTGELVYVQPETVGPGVNTMTGLPLDNPADYMPAPYDIAAQKAGGTADAQAAAAARTALPGAEQAFTLTQKALDSLIGPSPDPNMVAGEGEQFSSALGVPYGQMVGAIPGTNKSNFRNIVDQLSGQAFLQIRQALKGAGQVTDYEGAKGEAALSRMKLASQSGSKSDFDQALIDYKTAIENGYQLLKKQASGDFAAGNVPGLPNGQPQGGGDLSGMSDADLLNALGN